MSLLPVSLPLFPILNASEAVERMLEKNEEAAKAHPSEEKSKAEAAANDSAAADAGRPTNQITAVEGSAAVTEAVVSRAGAEAPPETERQDVVDQASEPTEAIAPDEGQPDATAQTDVYPLEIVAASSGEVENGRSEIEEDRARLDKRT